MSDQFETIGHGTHIQHEKLNDRIYLLKLDARDAKATLDIMRQLAQENNYSKIFCKVPKPVAPLFMADGYIMEACIPNFYNSSTDVFFMSKFLNSDRLLHIEKKQLANLSKLLSEPPQKPTTSQVKSKYQVRRLHESDAERISEIYRTVFESYPFPIDNPEYIKQTMGQNVQYYGAQLNGKLAALASSEMDREGKYAEMTDFATLPKHHGNNLSMVLLKTMEQQMQEQGIKTLFTIARLNSIPMNKTFLRLNYHYSGTLIKNTNIAGKIESMNVYYKYV
ncbi:beta-lysine acetyltransferase [Saccharicrinis carchari]|uniref:Beta-lysine acetyltransferase n=1 Tax=Saccharicrinis carchari TaxID=1168039 RepID=A0A521F223_SACCC|nr:putative beta-lysine N-acetyltransferase [Saccharicrinis carchari]SMO90157.1 beta-lysine acetyltransferase [Saccharicrinis carchari]